MSFYEIFSVTKENGDLVLDVAGNPCFASLFRIPSKELMEGNNILSIFHPLDLDKVRRDGVANWFNDEDRAFYIEKVFEITGIKYEMSVGTCKHFIGDTVSHPCNILTTRINDAKSFIQFKAAVIASRYLIEKPFAEFLKYSIAKYRNDPTKDFFKLLQYEHYQVPSFMIDHTWIPNQMFWGLISTEFYKAHMEGVKPMNKFGEIQKQHHKIFVDLSNKYTNSKIAEGSIRGNGYMSYNYLIAQPELNH